MNYKLRHYLVFAPLLPLVAVGWLTYLVFTAYSGGFELAKEFYEDSL